jgi:S-(hydroxymethyl)glutathione dehydrogenase/alcohol dehydrogenase
MKAAMFQGAHKPLLIDEVEIDKPKDHEVLVKVKACGVCHSDLHYVKGLVPMKIPTLLGHEAAGVVEQVGNLVTNVKPGDHVIALTVIYCGQCDQCISGNPSSCLNRDATRRKDDEKPRTSWHGQKVTPVSDGGAFAEFMLGHENSFVKIPDDMPFDRAALIGCAVTTGAGSVLNHAQVKPGTSIAVFGCGGIGLSAIQGARIAGALKIIAVDTVESKLAMARRLGATHTVDASSSDAVKAIRELTGGQGVDYAIEAVGLKKTGEQCVYSLGIRGMAVLIGMVPAGQKLEIEPGWLIGGARFLTGCVLGSNRFRIDAPRYIEYYRQGRLNLDEMVTRHCRLEEIDEAFKLMDGGDLVRSVVMFD